MKEISESQVSPELWETYNKALSGDAQAINALGEAYYHADGIGEDFDEAARLFRLSADQGYYEACYNLGMCYRLGKGVETDRKYAHEYFRRAAIEGMHEAEYAYGCELCRGEICKRDLERGMRFLKRSCSKGNPFAPHELSKIYISGILGAEDVKNYLHCLRLSADREYPLAMSQYGAELYQGKYLKRDPKEGMHWSKKAVDAGDMDALCNVGLAYAQADGVRKSLKKGRAMLEESAEKGCYRAVEILIDICKGELGGKPDPKGLAKWEVKLKKTKRMKAANSYLLSDSAQMTMSDSVWNMYNAAADGNPRAQYDFAVALRDGKGVPSNAPLSKKWLKLASDNGEPEAMFCQAMHFTEDPIMRMDLLTKSAEKGFPEAMYTLGRNYFKGKDVETDIEKGVQWLEKAAAKNHVEALDTLADAYVFGKGVEVDVPKARKYYDRAALRGYAPSQLGLGVLLCTNNAVPHEYEEAAGWFRASAAQGNKDAMAWLAYCYLCGWGVKQNYRRYFLWAKRAMNKGNTIGNAYVGDCYLNGLGVEQDVFKGIEILEKGSIAGEIRCAEALYDLYGIDPEMPKSEARALEFLERTKEITRNENLLNVGLQYFLGDLDKPSFEKAAKILRPMADKKGMFACEIVGMMYMLGRGVKQSYKRAKHYFDIGAEQMSECSLLMLAVIYHEGLGVEKNLEESDRCLVTAAERGNPEAMRIVLSRERKVDPTLFSKKGVFLEALYLAAKGEYDMAIEQMKDATDDDILPHMLRGMLHHLGLAENPDNETALAEFRKGGIVCRGYVGECLLRKGELSQSLKYFRSGLYTLEPVGMRGVASSTEIDPKKATRWNEDYSRLQIDSLYETEPTIGGGE